MATLYMKGNKIMGGGGGSGESEYAWQNCFRNKNLGTSLTEKQAEAIANNDFTDLWNGDYWEINDHRWRIVDNSGYLLGKGDTEFTTPHLLVMPDDQLMTGGMKSTNDTTGGYQGSLFISSYAAQCKTIVANAFGSNHIGTFRDLRSNAVTNGHASNWAWHDADVFLPSEAMIYGTTVWGDGYGIGYNTGITFEQLKLFQMKSDYVIARAYSNNTRQWYWLKDVVSSTTFAYVSGHGYASTGNASYTFAVRPLFALI